MPDLGLRPGAGGPGPQSGPRQGDGWQGDARRERGNIAILAPFFGAVLLLPPIINLFAGSVLPSGVPLEVAYLFAVWVLLIAGAALLALGDAFRTPAPRRDDDTPAPASAPADEP